MKKNKNTKITGGKVILVPYQETHVLRYHSWMQDASIQQLTASEPLSLQDEYAMQKSWREDDDKCTFIVLDKKLFDSTQDEVESMIGDVNLFINTDDIHQAELEVMIAVAEMRGGGRGRETCLLMMRYGIEALGVTSYLVKIGYDNAPSHNLFQKLRFKEVNYFFIIVITK
ncbi:hypothetical protein HELRODRAFT_157613 [Helobdella robusta]|uniref:N-acetyltransferase domain-containing protein n=1 Tax=Helobdella robusta TaxID=6412 RepID=T1EMD9_HELRO|nr:hypothetical protein HELRODRAFT_157613 [Helobdella robusta]ESN95886.1 hypothetical protein HELRODRAFT_157613 [Helobdella robusta]